MAYAVHVDIEPHVIGFDLDPLQQAGAAALLDERIRRITRITGPGALQISREHHHVAVHPSGAVILLMLDADALEFAEHAGRDLAEQVLADIPGLDGWHVASARVELNDALALEALHAAEGPNAPPPAPAERAAAHARTPRFGPSTERVEELRASVTARADMLAAFPLADLEADTHADAGRPVPLPAAQLARGALVYAAETLIDRLFLDLARLTGTDESVSSTEGWNVLGALPQANAQRYTRRFTQRFIVAAVTLTARLTRTEWASPLSTAELLALRLLLQEAEGTLDLYGLTDRDTSRALALLSERAHGRGRSPALSRPPGAEDPDRWFDPFTPGTALHPYGSGLGANV